MIRSDRGLTLETWALYGDQFALSTQLLKPNYFIIIIWIISPLGYKTRNKCLCLGSAGYRRSKLTPSRGERGLITPLSPSLPQPPINHGQMLMGKVSETSVYMIFLWCTGNGQRSEETGNHRWMEKWKRGREVGVWLSEGNNTKTLV